MNPNQVSKLRLDHPPENEPKGRKGERNGVVVAVVLLILAAGAAFYLARAKQASPTAASAERRAEVRPPVPVSASPAGNFTAAGYLEAIPPYPITVSALVAGRLDQFDVLEGSTVQMGEVIARLNSALPQKRLAEVTAEIAVQEAKLARAEQVLGRTEKLAAIGSLPVREVERAAADAAVARAEGKRLQAALELARWQLEHTEVRAPIAGVVFERLAQVGEHLSPEASDRKGAAILSLYSPDKIQAWVDVTQRDAGRVAVGQRVEVSLDAEPGKIYAGRVLRLQPRASLQKNTVQVKIAIEQPSAMLRPDMSVKASFFPAGPTADSRPPVPAAQP